MSMNKTQVLLALLLSAGLVACGDDATEDTTTDTTPDTTDAGDDTTEPDTIEETGPDPDVDTTPDIETTPDVDTAPDVELCGDEIDNDGDGDIDCDDSDCEADLFACPPVTEECDCDEATEICIGGTCEPLTTIDEYEPAENWSYVSRLYLPGQDDDECCFDFNNDGLIDNGLATSLLPLLSGFVGDIQETIDEAFEGGDISLLLEWRQHPDAGTGPVKLSFWLGESDSTYADLAAGNGTVQVNDDSYGEAGSFIQFNTAEMDGYALTAGPSLFRLQIPLGDLLEGLDLLDLTIQAARIEAELDSADFRATVNDGDIGGGKLGGVLPLDQIFGTINDLLMDCTCAEGIDGTTDVIAYGDGDGVAYSAQCVKDGVQTSSFNVSACDTEVCNEYLNLICGTALPALSAIPLADIDTNGNGVEDAISIGGYLTMVGAEIADPWFAGDEGEGSGEEGSGAL